MDKKRMSGHCRSLVLAVLFLVLFCGAIAVAADCPSGCSCLRQAEAKEKGYDPCGGQPSMCGYDVYQQTMYCYKTPLSITLRTLPPLSVVTATTTQPVACPEGCYCMLQSDAREKLGPTYTRCSEKPCYSVVTGSQKLDLYCYRMGTTTTTTPVPACPQGCSCISEATAKARGGIWSRCLADPCGYEQSTATLAAVVNVPKFCMKQESTTPACPEGCVCITDAMAKDRYGTFTRCRADSCGYEVSAPTSALAATQVAKYCVKPATVTPVCPQGCACLSDEKAKARYGDYTRCSAEVCGKEIIQPAGAAAYSVPQYCVKQAETTPDCPEGCACITDAVAKDRYGTFTRCHADPCGYEMSTLTTAAYQIPKYCVKQGSTPVCPEGCACISEEDAKLKGLTDRCDNSQTPCGYRTMSATGTTAARRIPLFCYKIPTTTTTPQVCPEACYCLKPEEAKEKFGPDNFARCRAEPCSNDQTRYCFKPIKTPTAPVCPQGCVCTTDEIAKIKGLTPCRGERKSCGTNSDKQSLYCFEQVPSPTCVYDYQKNVCTGTCPEGYTCGLLASKKDATGKVVYAVCGCTGQPTAQCTFDKEKKACAGACRNGGTCAVVGNRVDDKAGEVIVVCGCPPPASDQCTFDKEKQACTGTCPNNAACTIVGRKTDDTGEVYTFCGCPQPTGQCTLDKEKQACTGTCPNNAACAVIGRKTDDKTGEVVVSCGCPQPSSCVYDYSKEACAGTCTKTGDICQLNSIYRDPASGKVIYAECHCKGSGEVPETCACDKTTGACSGSCDDSRTCIMVERTTDNAGKILCSRCECRDTCVLTTNNECSGTCPTGEPCMRVVTKDDSGQEKVSCNCGGSQPGTPAGVAPRPPGIFEAIASFFNKLFGGK